MSTNFSQNIIKDKNFKIKPLEVYSKISLSFLKDFSFELRQNKNMKNFPDLIYLMYWCNECHKSIKKNILHYSYVFNNLKLKVSSQKFINTLDKYIFVSY